jgi:hypothetical protein
MTTEYAVSIWQRQKEEFMHDVYRTSSCIDLREVWRTKNLVGYGLIFHDDQDLLFFKLKYPQIKKSNTGWWVTQNA